MTFPAKTQKVGECVCFLKSLDAKRLERDDVSHTERFFKITAISLTLSALVLVALSRCALLPPPVRAVIHDCAASPVRASICVESRGEPFQPALIPAKSLGGFADPYDPHLAAGFAHVRHPSLLTFFGAVNSGAHNGRGPGEYYSARNASLFDLRPYLRAVHRTKSLSVVCGGENSSTLFALHWLEALAVEGTKAPPMPVGSKALERLSAAFAFLFHGANDNAFSSNLQHPNSPREEATRRLDQLLAYEFAGK